MVLKRTGLGFSNVLQRRIQMKLVLSARKLLVHFYSPSWILFEDISGPAKNKITIKIVSQDKILYSTITCLSRGPLCIQNGTKEHKHPNVSGNILEEDVRPDMVINTQPLSNRTIILHWFCLKNEPGSSSVQTSNIEPSIKSFKIGRLYPTISQISWNNRQTTRSINWQERKEH